jgi:transposase
MPAPRKYPEELKERATRLAVDARRDARTRRGAIARIAGQLDIHPEALRGWVRWAEAASSTTNPSSRSGTRNETGVSGQGEERSDRQRILELEAKNRELTRANLILRQAATFFGAELDRQHR